MNLKLVKLQSLVSGILGLILAAEWGYSGFANRQLQQSLQFSPDDSSLSVELPTIAEDKPDAEEFSELVDRPLFMEGRKPVVEAPPTEKALPVEAGQIDDWALIGIYNKDKKQMALFRHKNETKKYLKIGSEQTISGWILKEIQADRVILEQAGQQKSVLLRKPRAESKSAPAGRPPVPGKPGRPVKPAPTQPTNNNPENESDESQTN